MRRRVASERVELRASPQAKHFFELAAFAGGYPDLTKFMISAAQEMAEKIFQDIDSHHLTEEDKDLLFELLDKAPAPNKALKNVYDKISKAYYVSDEGHEVQKVKKSLIKSPKKAVKKSGK